MTLRACWRDTASMAVFKYQYIPFDVGGAELMVADHYTSGGEVDRRRKAILGEK